MVGWIKKYEKNMDGWMDKKMIWIKKWMVGWMEKKDGWLDG